MLRKAFFLHSSSGMQGIWLLKYRPDDKVARKERLLKRAQAVSEGKIVEAKKPIVVKCGPDHVAYLIEQNKPQLVVIAHDVNPSELFVWLPTLCRKMEVPYCIVKGKARIGSVYFLMPLVSLVECIKAGTFEVQITCSSPLMCIADPIAKYTLS